MKSQNRTKSEKQIQKIYNEAMKKLEKIHLAQKKAISVCMKKLEAEKIKILTNKLKH